MFGNGTNISAPGKYEGGGKLTSVIGVRAMGIWKIVPTNEANPAQNSTGDKPQPAALTATEKPIEQFGDPVVVTGGSRRARMAAYILFRGDWIPKYSFRQRTFLTKTRLLAIEA